VQQRGLAHPRRLGPAAADDLPGHRCRQHPSRPPFGTDEHVRDAATLAGADRFIRGLPASYGTLVGDGGRPLSAGERRRIALARAFLRDAPLVVLDEPTADLDPLSAGVVAEAVERLRQRRTVLLIAHRQELVTSADRAVFLVDGRSSTWRKSEVA
jgi:ABC-type multidrug transport system fused ATPase/permease subunit